MRCVDRYSVGIPALGEEHNRVFERFVCVKQAMAKGSDWNDIHLAVASLIKSFEFCAALEEALMRIHDYPGREHHEQEHADLLQSLHALEKANLTTGLTQKMIGSTFASTMKHHLTQDRRCARYLPQPTERAHAARQ